MNTRRILILAVLVGFTGTLTRPAQAEEPFPVRVPEAQDGKLVITAPGPDMQRAVTLVLNGDQATLTDIRIALGPVSREDGRPIPANALTCGGCGSSLSLARGAWLSVSISGTGLEPGPTLSFLQISALTRTLVIPVTVTRAPLTQTAQIVAPAAWAGTRDGATPLEFAFDVRETSGRDAVVRLPSVTPLQVVDKNGAWRGVEETPLQKVRVASPGPQIGPAEDNSAAVTLIGGAYTRFVVRFGDLPAGSYKGQIRLSGSNSAETTQDFTLTLRDPPALALLVIALGVALAFVLNRWTKGERERRVRRIAILNERDQMARAAELSPLKPDPVWDELLFRLDDMLNRNAVALPASGETADSINTALADIRSRRVKYVDVLKLQAAVNGLLAEFGADLSAEKERLGSSAAAALAAAREALCEAQGQGLETDLVKPLKDIFDQGRKMAITRSADALGAEIEGAKAHELKFRPALNLPGPATFEADIQAVSRLVAETRSLADKNAFLEAIAMLEKARGGFFDLRYQQLDRNRTALMEKLDNDDKWQKTQAFLADTRARLKDALEALGLAARLRNLSMAGTELDNALESYVAAATPAGAPRPNDSVREVGIVRGQTSLGAFARFVEAFIPAGRFANPEASRQTAATEVAKVRSYDLLVAVTVIAAACLTGFASLYLDSATFGAFGGRDYITAFLWGFGWQALTSTLVSLGTETGLVKA